MKLVLKYTFFLAFLSIIGIVMWSSYVSYSIKGNIYNEVSDIPSNHVGLLLGTAPRVQNGQTNLYYKYRLNAAVELHQKGKIKRILCSGDNGTKYYNEPKQMKIDLIKRGIPSEDIYLDYAGFRTLDSVMRSKEVFGQTSITLISQEFHNQRALFIAKSKGIDAVGFNAQRVNNSSAFKMSLREKIARAKMALDLIFKKQPKFLGESIVIL